MYDVTPLTFPRFFRPMAQCRHESRGAQPGPSTQQASVVSSAGLQMTVTERLIA